MSSISLVPHPTLCVPGEGSLTLGEFTYLRAPSPLVSSAEQIAKRLRKATSYEFPVAASSVDGGTRVEFIHDSGIENPEAYTLKVDADGVVIRASGAAGAFYAGQTLLQLLPPAIFDETIRHDIEWTVPFVTIEDTPRFRWRGVMLDSARYFQPASYIRKFIDLAAQHKLNVFHWHLVDDQGWRIEIKKYPRLTEIGSTRKETQVGHWFHKNRSADGTPHGGFYTQEEIASLVAYAAERHVQILPEIEMPGHAQAAVAAYPELGMGHESLGVSTIWGVHKTLFNTRPSTFKFLQDVLDEVIALFPFTYLHIGGDEAVKDQWKESAEIQAHIKELGLTNEDELQCWFIAEMAKFLASRSRKLVGWDEILEGGLGEGATVMSWRGREGAVEATKRGLEAILCDNNFLYLDYYQSESVTTEPLAIGGSLTLEKIYSYDPFSSDAELSEEMSKNLLGIQAQVWTEYIPNTSRLEYMAFPRLCAFSDVAWSGQKRPDFAHFIARLGTHLRRLDNQDVRYRAPLEWLGKP